MKTLDLLKSQQLKDLGAAFIGTIILLIEFLLSLIIAIAKDLMNLLSRVKSLVTQGIEKAQDKVNEQKSNQEGSYQDRLPAEVSNREKTIREDEKPDTFKDDERENYGSSQSGDVQNNV